VDIPLVDKERIAACIELPTQGNNLSFTFSMNVALMDEKRITP
jgi:hypothetical protein